MPDIWEIALAGLQSEAASLTQDQPLDIWDQALAEYEPEPQRLPEVSLREPGPAGMPGGAPIVTEFLPEGQAPPERYPEVSLPPIERAPSAFPPIQMPPPPAPEPQPLQPMHPPAMIPPEAEPYRPSYDYMADIQGVTPPQGPPVVEPPYGAPLTPREEWVKEYIRLNAPISPYGDVKYIPPDRSEGPLYLNIAGLKIPEPGQYIEDTINAVTAGLTRTGAAGIRGLAAAAPFRFGGVQGGRPVQPFQGETPGASYLRMKQEPLVLESQQEAERAQQEVPLWARNKLWTQAGEQVGGFAPMLAAGGMAGLVAASQNLGGRVDSAFKANKAKGMTDDQAAQAATEESIASAAAGEISWTVLPGPAKSLFDRLVIDKLANTTLKRVAGGTLKRFVAGRVAKATEGYAVGASVQAAENVATGRPVYEGVHEAGSALAMANVFFPGGKTAREIASGKLDLSKPENFHAVDVVVPLRAGERGAIPIGKFIAKPGEKLTSVDSSGRQHTGELDPNLRVEPGLIDMRAVEEDAPGLLREKPYYVPAKLGEVGLDPKTVKGEKRGYKTFIMYLAAHKQAGLGINVCKFATVECSGGCLGKGGMGSFDSVKSARVNKTKFFHYDQDRFLAKLDRDITREKAKARAAGFNFAIRLNGTSDILWENSGIM